VIDLDLLDLPADAAELQPDQLRRLLTDRATPADRARLEQRLRTLPAQRTLALRTALYS
jgi:hypothetical protein